MRKPPKPKNTRQLMAMKRRKLVAAAKQIPDGELRIQPLAIVAGVSTLTARKWIVEAGIDIRRCKRGRPRAGEAYNVDSVKQLIMRASEVGQANLDFAASQEADNDAE